MALNIRNPRTDQLATELAKLTGESKTQAVTKALSERLERVKRRGGLRLADELDRLALHCSRRAIGDNRSADEIIGYDESGLP